MNFKEFEELSHEEIRNIIAEVYTERLGWVQHAAAEYEADRRSASKRNRMHELSNIVLGVEAVIDALGLDNLPD